MGWEREESPEAKAEADRLLDKVRSRFLPPSLAGCVRQTYWKPTYLSQGCYG